jgi:hypothetical protein
MANGLTDPAQERRARMPGAERSPYGRAPDLRDAVEPVLRRVPPTPRLGDLPSGPTHEGHR